MQKRGVTESSTLDIIKLCFNSSGYADAVGAQLDRAGKVINPRQAVMRQGMDAIERCPWVDTTKGLTKHEMRDREAKAMAQRAVIGTDDPHAFNFREPIPTTVEDDRSYSSSVVTESKSLAEFSTFEMERGDTVYHCEAPTKTAATENEDWEGFGEDEDWTTDEVGVAGFIDMSLLTTTGEEEYSEMEDERGREGQQNLRGGVLHYGATPTKPTLEQIARMDARAHELGAELASVVAERDKALEREQEVLSRNATAPEKEEQPVDETFTGLASATAVIAPGGATKMPPPADSAVQGGGASAVADHSAL
jgi:hypothetical protein